MNTLWSVIEQSCGTALKLMSCLCLLHIFTQMIVMEMIICLSLHIKRDTAPWLSDWGANRENVLWPKTHRGEQAR